MAESAANQKPGSLLKLRVRRVPILPLALFVSACLTLEAGLTCLLAELNLPTGLAPIWFVGNGNISFAGSVTFSTTPTSGSWSVDVLASAAARGLVLGAACACGLQALASLGSLRIQVEAD